MARIFREATTDREAQAIAARIRRMDYELMSIVTGGSGTGRNPMNLRTSCLLARMQRQLRRLRYDMEVERGFDTACHETSKGNPQ